MKQKLWPGVDRVIRSSRRTLGLEITEDARLVVRAPLNAPQKGIEKILFKKRFWIESRQKIAKARSEETGRFLRHYRAVDAKPLKQKALEQITKSAETYAARAGVKYKSLRLSNARKRWGSCSLKGDVRVNWRLVLAPSEVLDYVVVHELMHLEEKNHGKKFWGRVRQFIPDYERHREWLRRNQNLLNL